MKTYAELTDEQFKYLHRIAHNITHNNLLMDVSRYRAKISVWKVIDANRDSTTFDGVTGEIFCENQADPLPVRNMWHIIRALRDVGIDYAFVQAKMRPSASTLLNEMLNEDE